MGTTDRTGRRARSENRSYRIRVSKVEIGENIAVRIELREPPSDAVITRNEICRFRIIMKHVADLRGTRRSIGAQILNGDDMERPRSEWILLPVFRLKR